MKRIVHGLAQMRQINTDINSVNQFNQYSSVYHKKDEKNL